MDWQSADGVARILVGDCLQRLRDLPDCSVQCCVTSPPYWGLRDYGNDAQLGLESTPEKYVENMVAVFREVHRILRPDGTLWLNLGDSYFSTIKGDNRSREQKLSSSSLNLASDKSQARSQHDISGVRLVNAGSLPIKPKDLVGIPWRVAFALQADGWWLRQDLIWHKPAPMPESVTDRCTKAHEYVFLLAKNERYFYDAEAIKEAVAPASIERAAYGLNSRNSGFSKDARTGSSFEKTRTGVTIGEAGFVNPAGRNRRSVWKVSTKPYKGAHFATMPPDLVDPCILAGTSEAGCCEACGAPLYRQTNKTKLKRNRPNAYTKRTGKDGTGNSCANDVAGVAIETTGWLPSCDCNAGVIPCLVLDPFGGSGTTVAVAAKLGRRGVCCELNPEYVKLAIERITPNLPSAKHPLLKG